MAGEDQRPAKHVLNSRLVPELEIPAEVTVGRLIAAGDSPPPKDTKGKQFCFAFHCKGACNTDCGRQFSHRALSKADIDLLGPWVTAAKAKLG